MVPEPSRPGDQTVAGCSVSGATDHMGRDLHLQNQAPTAAGSVRGKYFQTEKWPQLPVGMWSMICRLTGTAPPHSLPTDRDMDPIDISHLWKEYPVPCMEICWMLLDITELVTHGYDRGAGDEQLFLYLDPDSIHFQSDNLRRVKQNKDPKRRRVEPPGQLDPSIDAILADVFPILEGDTGREWLALVSPTYKWQAHYINATPDSLLQRLYYDRPIADVIGGTYGDRLAIKFDVTKRLEAFSGSADAIGGPVLLGGLDSDLVLRTGMGVAFKISEHQPCLRQRHACQRLLSCTGL